MSTASATATARQAEAAPARPAQMIKAAAHVPRLPPAAEAKAGIAAKVAALKDAAAKLAAPRVGAVGALVPRGAEARVAAAAEINPAEQGRLAAQAAPAVVAVAPVTTAAQAELRVVLWAARPKLLAAARLPRGQTEQAHLERPHREPAINLQAGFRTTQAAALAAAPHSDRFIFRWSFSAAHSSPH